MKNQWSNILDVDVHQYGCNQRAGLLLVDSCHVQGVRDQDFFHLVCEQCMHVRLLTSLCMQALPKLITSLSRGFFYFLWSIINDTISNQVCDPRTHEKKISKAVQTTTLQYIVIKKCSFKVMKRALSRHWQSEAEIICIFCHLSWQETHLGLVCETCLLCSWAPIAFCPLSLVRDSDPIFELTCNPLWIAFHENNMRGKDGETD